MTGCITEKYLITLAGMACFLEALSCLATTSHLLPKFHHLQMSPLREMTDGAVLSDSEKSLRPSSTVLVLVDSLMIMKAPALCMIFYLLISNQPS